MPNLVIVNYNRAGDHWLRRRDGSIIQIPREAMVEAEEFLITPESYLPGYTQDPAWFYRWRQAGEDLKARRWIESLSADQLQALKEQLSRG